MGSSYQIWIVALIVVFSGIFGGWTAFLADRTSVRTNSDQADTSSLSRNIALGLSATICVPLFLSLVQSALIPKIFSPDQVGDRITIPYTEFLVFFGICVLAAISARRFLDTLSDRVLRDVSKFGRLTESAGKQAAAAELKAEAADKKAEDASALSSEILDEKAVQARNEGPGLDVVPSAAAPSVELNELERKTLSALSKVTFRTATGIGVDIGIPRTQVGDLLDALAEKKLIEPTVSPTTGGPRWRITPAGVNVVGA